MKVIFFGSGDIGLPTLQWLLGDPQTELCAVVTQPDRPAGRGLALKPSAIKETALSKSVTTLQPSRVRAEESVAMIAAYEPDLFVVMAYGQILPQTLLDVPKRGALNLHASLLPRHRGAAPVHAAVLSGDARSGITVMWMDAGLDTGDILLMQECELAADETAGSLHDRLADLAPLALAESLVLIREGRAQRFPQDKQQATYAPKLDRGVGKIDWSASAVEIERKIRGLSPWPGSSTQVELESGNGLDLKVHRASVVDGAPDPGMLRFACGGGGVLHLQEIQAAGGRRMAAEEFCRGYKIRGLKQVVVTQH